MVSIIEAIGENYKEMLLKDNEDLSGGKSHSEETLGEFMEENNISHNSDYGLLCVTLEKNGLKAVRPIKYVDQSLRYEYGYDEFDLLTNW